MLKVFGVLAASFKQHTTPRVDNAIFRLHYRATTVLLLASCILVCTRQFIGNPIQCITDGKIPGHVINTYCFIMSTFTVPDYHDTEIGKESPHPGVGTPGIDGGGTEYHAYYQWVPFVLFLQAAMFYFPHYLWKIWDDGKFPTLIQGLNNKAMVMKSDDRKSKHRCLIKYVMGNLHEHNMWAFKFFFCEFLNVVNCIGNIYFTDYFLGYQFSKYGSEVLSYIQTTEIEDRTDPMDKVFPKVTKCTFHSFGPSGTIQKHDSLCVLALNIINEKIYTFLWFWFIILAVVTCLGLAYRLFIVLAPAMRYNLLKLRGRLLGDKRYLDVIIEKCQIGDWLLLYHLGRHMNGMSYGEFLQGLGEAMDRGYGTEPRAPKYDPREDTPLKPNLDPEYPVKPLQDELNAQLRERH